MYELKSHASVHHVKPQVLAVAYGELEVCIGTMKATGGNSPCRCEIITSEELHVVSPELSNRCV